jgi:diadenosine tetraphosphatase ApaH/serine/threonine PP2A family protein phosphatase
MAHIGVISDIHSNLAALEAVIDAAGSLDGWWCLGDIVGYGPDPNEVIEAIQDIQAICIRGNHDDGVQHLNTLAWFNSTAGMALDWTARQLSEGSWRFLRGLPESSSIDGYHLVHGSPRHSLTEYVTNAQIAESSLGLIEEDVCFIGHTHVPSSFIKPAKQASVDVNRRLDGENAHFEPGARQIINAGSVGQPRDGDARAAFGVLDTTQRTFTWFRVPYEIQITQQKMRAAALPAMLIDRLSEGW